MNRSSAPRAIAQRVLSLIKDVQHRYRRLSVKSKVSEEINCEADSELIRKPLDCTMVSV